MVEKNRILLKISGESLMGSRQFGLDIKQVNFIANVIKEVFKIENFKTKELDKKLKNFDYNSALFIYSENGIDKNFKLVTLTENRKVKKNRPWVSY